MSCFWRLLPAVWLVAQLDRADGITVRACWIMRGVAVVANERADEPYWLNIDASLGGRLERITVQGGDLRGAANRLGIADPSKCL